MTKFFFFDRFLNRKNFNFFGTNFPQGTNPLSDFFYKTKGGEGVQRPYTNAKFQFSLLKCGLAPQKSPKFVIFCIHVNLPTRRIHPEAIFTKFGLGRESQVRTLMPNIVTVG